MEVVKLRTVYPDKELTFNQWCRMVRREMNKKYNVKQKL